MAYRADVAKAVVTMLSSVPDAAAPVGDFPGLRAGWVDTPERFAKAWAHHTGGYSTDPVALLKAFEDGAEDYDEMVAVVDIPFYSLCEHHLAPFFGTATIAYIPNGRVAGLSKLARVLDAYARRLQVQERLTQQVVSALMEGLQPLGAACKVRARHLCMESRGVAKTGHHTVTTKLAGAFRTEPSARAEFLAL